MVTAYVRRLVTELVSEWVPAFRFHSLPASTTVIDRDAALVIYGMQPLLFDGTRRTVSRCLAGDARLWWMTLGEPAIPGGSWADFCALIIARYGPLPDEDTNMPYRDPEIYNDMYLGRYLSYVADWEELPPEVRLFVLAPMMGMTLESMIDDIMQAEIIAHMTLFQPYPLQEIPPQEVEAGADDDDIDPADFPVDSEENPENPPVIIIESDYEEDVEEEQEEWEEQEVWEEQEEDLEEILFDDGDWDADSDVFSDVTTE
ncbi:hypothetical protein TIFTF001_032768 [Ficus carica]|uniref:Uncharacterized protein n=1 Tax=Ficus carica TaxID=3494 RepID=A0AA88DX95_FICCA|nr:hypothetical protein TIFTF001_032768 [Ficus carica]